MSKTETNLMSSRWKRLIDGGDFGFDNVGIAPSWRAFAFGHRLFDHFRTLDALTKVTQVMTLTFFLIYYGD